MPDLPSYPMDYASGAAMRVRRDVEQRRKTTGSAGWYTTSPMKLRLFSAWLAVTAGGWGLLGAPWLTNAFGGDAPDVSPPKVRIASPAQGEHVRGAVSIEVEISDNGEIREVSVSRDGAFLKSTDIAPYQVDWDTGKEMEGPHTLVARALDAAGNEGSSPFVTVTVDNTPPTVKLSQPARQQTVTGKIALEAQASDIIGVAEVRFTVNGLPSGSVRKPPYTSLWESKAVSNGVHVLEARALDLAGNSAVSEPVEIRVSNTNKPPVLSVTAGAKSVSEGETLEFRLTATDPDGPRDIVTFRGIDLPAWVKLDSRTGEVVAAPDRQAATLQDPQKVYPLRFQACDPEPLCASIQVPVTVNNVNSAPELRAMADLSVREGKQLLFTLDAARDPDGDLLTYSTGPLPGWLRFDRESRTFSGTPDYDTATLEEPTVSVTVTTKVTDPEGHADEKSFGLSVVNRNRPPKLKRISDKTQPEGRTFAFVVEASDPDEEIPTLTASGIPSGAVFQDGRDGTGTFLWASREDQAGTYKVVFSASDGELKDTQTVAIKLEEVSLSLSGTIKNILEEGFPDATVRLTRAGQPLATVTTDSKGYFIATDLRSATYTVKPNYAPSEEFSVEARASLGGYHFQPLSKRVTLDRTDQTGVDFTAHPD